MNWPTTTRLVRRLASAGLCGLAVLSLTQCRKSPTGPMLIGASDLTAPATAAVVQAFDGVTFTFQGVAQMLDATLAGQDFSIAFTNTSAASPTATFTLQSGSVVASATLGSSCSFRITSSTIGALPVGQTLTFTVCSYLVKSAGMPVGVETSVPVAFQLATTGTASFAAPGSASSERTIAAQQSLQSRTNSLLDNLNMLLNRNGNLSFNDHNLGRVSVTIVS